MKLSGFTNKEILECFLTEKSCREMGGFLMPGCRALEDTAMLLDLSIQEVCKAIAGDQWNVQRVIEKVTISKQQDICLGSN